MRLLNKVAFITGGGVGIGKEISLMFAREGANISLAARSTIQMEEVAHEIKTIGQKALVNTMDITSVEQVDRAVEETLKEFGRIDILVNNSGIAGPSARANNGVMFIYSLVVNEMTNGGENRTCSKEKRKKGSWICGHVLHADPPIRKNTIDA